MINGCPRISGEEEMILYSPELDEIVLCGGNHILPAFTDGEYFYGRGHHSFREYDWVFIGWL